MRLLVVPVVCLVLLSLVLAGCSTDNHAVAPVDGNNTSAALVSNSGTGSFALEAKYTYFRNYPGGQAIYLLKINPGPDFSGDVTVKVSAARLMNTELTTRHLNAENAITELLVSPSKQSAYGSYFITVTASNRTHQESIELELELVDWGVNSAELAVEARDQFVVWMAVEHPELGSFAGEQWDLYCHYPTIIIHEHYTHLSDNWEFRVSCHITWTPEDYYTTLWLRPRGAWDPVLAAKRGWDEASQMYIIYETSLEDWNYIYGY